MKRIIIIEGPDGAGKTTLVDLLAGDYVVTKHGSYPDEAQIWKRFFDSMLPAYSDKADVLLDRSWISEPIYGAVYRHGLNRIEPWQKRLLEHITDKCETKIVWCLPPVEVCIDVFNSRKESEMLDDEFQLREVYSLYNQEALCSGVGMIYDRTVQQSSEVLKYVS
jgi:thymidylate kinase